eukprot:272622-Chlamydomonas_euryale.AAC.9
MATSRCRCPGSCACRRCADGHCDDGACLPALAELTPHTGRAAEAQLRLQAHSLPCSLDQCSTAAAARLANGTNIWLYVATHDHNSHNKISQQSDQPIQLSPIAAVRHERTQSSQGVRVIVTGGGPTKGMPAASGRGQQDRGDQTAGCAPPQEHHCTQNAHHCIYHKQAEDGSIGRSTGRWKRTLQDRLEDLESDVNTGASSVALTMGSSCPDIPAPLLPPLSTLFTWDCCMPIIFTKSSQSSEPRKVFSVRTTSDSALHTRVWPANNVSMPRSSTMPAKT